MTSSLDFQFFYMDVKFFILITFPVLNVKIQVNAVPKTYICLTFKTLEIFGIHHQYYHLTESPQFCRSFIFTDSYYFKMDNNFKGIVNNHCSLSSLSYYLLITKLNTFIGDHNDNSSIKNCWWLIYTNADQNI